MKKSVSIKRKISRNSTEEFSFVLAIGNQFFPLNLKEADSELLSFLLKEDEAFKKTGEVELPLFIEKKSFVDRNNDDANVVEYISYYFEIDGNVFDLRPEAKYKRLLNYLLGREGI